MKTFKQFVTEVLTQAQKDTVDGWEKGDNSFSNKAFNSKSDQRVSVPLEYPDSPSEHRKSIQDHLGKHGITIKDYNSGTATDKYGREVKIGKALGQTKASDDLKSAFENDPARQQRVASTAANDFHVVISRHPHDVAGMTSGGHSWEHESCMNFESGIGSLCLPQDVKHGTHTAWLTKKDDTDLNSPVARISLKQFINIDNPKDTILRPENRTYGSAPDAFSHTVNKWAKENFPERSDGIYRKNKRVYDDTKQKYYMGKGAIDRALKHEDGEIRAAAAIHPEISEDQIHKALDHKDIDVRDLVAGHKNASQKNIFKALGAKQEDSTRISAASNSNANEDNLNHALKDDYDKVRMAAASNHNATSNVLNNALHRDQFVSVRAAAAKNINASEHHLNTALNDDNANVRAAAASNRNASVAHLDKAFADNEQVRTAAAGNRNATKEHLDKVLGMGAHTADESEYVRAAAAGNRNVTKEHIDKALSDHSEDGGNVVRAAAAGNRNATGAHLDTALSDEDHEVRSIAARHKNATKEQLQRALNDKHWKVVDAAENNPNYHKYFKD